MNPRVRLFPRIVMFLGIVYILAGLATAGMGVYINNFVTNQLARQQIVTTEDASIPNTPVRDIPTALAMADIIQHHANESSGGLSYAQMGRFAVPSGDPAGTNDAEAALKDPAGKPVPNQARSTQQSAASLVTALSLSAMAIGASYGAIALGVGFALLGAVIIGLGYALYGLITPAIAERYGLKPATTEPTSHSGR